MRQGLSQPRLLDVVLQAQQIVGWIVLENSGDFFSEKLRRESQEEGRLSSRIVVFAAVAIDGSGGF